MPKGSYCIGTEIEEAELFMRKLQHLSVLRRLRGRFSAFDVGIWLLALSYVVLIILPLYYLFVSAFKDNSEIFSSPLGLPLDWSLRKFEQAEEIAHLLRAMGFTGIVTIGTEVLLILVSFPAAYAIARIPSRFSSLVESILGAGFLIPGFALLLPTFFLVAKVGLLFKPTALLFVYPAHHIPFSTLLIASYLRNAIPHEVEESAQLDGAGRLQILLRIILPLATPIIFTVLVLTFIGVWNEFMMALILLGPEYSTVQTAMPQLGFLTKLHVDYGAFAAAAFMTVAPIYIMFVLFQERITSGLTKGAVKG